MGILDWWCHPFHHCPNSSFNSLEFHLRNNLPWILWGCCANCSVPWLLRMLMWKASSESARLACACPVRPRDTALPSLPGLSCALAQGQLLVVWGLLGTDLGLLKVQPAHHLLSPSPEWSRLDSSPQHLSYSQSRKSWFNSPVQGCVWIGTRNYVRKPATLLWTRGRVYGIKIDMQKPSLVAFTSELKAGYPMTKWKQYNLKANL